MMNREASVLQSLIVVRNENRCCIHTELENVARLLLYHFYYFTHFIYFITLSFCTYILETRLIMSIKSFTLLSYEQYGNCKTKPCETKCTVFKMHCEIYTISLRILSGPTMPKVLFEYFQHNSAQAW